MIVSLGVTEDSGHRVASALVRNRLQVGSSAPELS
jgi:hypothetical protein